MHSSFGNTSATNPAAARATNSLAGPFDDDGWSLLSLNMKGLMLPDESSAGSEACELKWRHLEACISLWQPAILCLQELGGSSGALQTASDRLRKLGYSCDWLPGEPQGTHVSHRHGGVLVAWKNKEFRADTGGPRSDRSRPGFALLTAGDIENAADEGTISACVAKSLSDYVGRRAICVRLTRRRGTLTNEPLNVASVYVPPGASDAVRAGFIGLVASSLRRTGADGTPWVSSGDWQASPSPDWRHGKPANKAHDHRIASLFWGIGCADGLDEHSGACVDLGLDHSNGCFSFHAKGLNHHRTIDHVFTDFTSAASWKVAAGGLTFLGGHGADFDSNSLFDHRTILVWKSEGLLAQLGSRRAQAHRLKKLSARTDFLAAAAKFQVNWDTPADAELERLESELADLVAAAGARAVGDPEFVRAAPPDDLETRLRYYGGLVKRIRATFTTEAKEGRSQKLLGFFCTPNDTGLYRASFLSKLRDRELQRIARRRGSPLDMNHMRRVLLRASERAFLRLQPQVASKRRKELEAIRMGTLEPSDPQALAQQMLSRQREIKSAERSDAFKVTSLRGPDGKLESAAPAVHEIALNHGIKQNGKSSCLLAALGQWLAAFVPHGETVLLPNGSPWTLRDAIPFEVFAREVQRAASGKAAALHPFLVDHLQMLPREHPTLATYYELMIRCMESGVYPKHYLSLIAILIPKTYGSLVDISALRDIWLINHGAKLAERCLLHTGLAPLSTRYLAVAAGGCKGRGCVEQAFALHAAISDAHATCSDIFVLYVDLIKCFMSFDRDAGELAATWAGLPPAVSSALRGLTDSLKHGVVSGRYETAFGSTDEFDILRGFLQGSLSAPEMCKLMMNTLAEALELKIVGYNSFTPDGGGSYLTQLIFVDDAANVTGSGDMMVRVALLWSCWCRITGCQMNVEKLKKTVSSGLVWGRSKDGRLRPVTSKQRIFICGLMDGDPARAKSPTWRSISFISTWVSGRRSTANTSPRCSPSLPASSVPGAPRPLGGGPPTPHHRVRQLLHPWDLLLLRRGHRCLHGAHRGHPRSCSPLLCLPPRQRCRQATEPIVAPPLPPCPQHSPRRACQRPRA